MGKDAGRAPSSRARCAGFVGVLCATVALAGPALAQRTIMTPNGPVQIGPDGQPINPGGPPQPAKPEGPTTQAATIIVPASSQPTTGPAAGITLNFKDATADAVLDYLVNATGYTLIKEGNVDGRVTIETRRPVTPAEAIQLLNTVLRIQGYALIKQGSELHVMRRSVAKKADVPVRFGANPADVPMTDEVFTQVIPVGKSDVARLKQDLQPLVGPDADFTANRDTNALVLTDTSRNIHRIVQIIAELDRQGASTSEIRIFKLKHSDATQTSKLIAAVFKSGGDGPMDRQMMYMIQSGQMQGDALDKALRGGKNVIAVPDDRTGTLVVTGPSDSLKIVDKIIDSLEADEVQASEVKIFTLKYADADSAATLITDMFKTDDGSNNNPFRYFYFSDQPKSDSSGKPFKVIATADFRTGTLIVTASPAQMKVISEVLEKLDTNPTAESSFFIYRLKNGQADNLQLVLNTLFGVGPENNQQNQNGQNGPNNQNGQNGQNNNGRSNGSRNGNSGGFGGFGNNSSSSGNGAFGTGGKRSHNSANKSQLSTSTQHMIGEMAGEVFVVADLDTNSLLVTTASKFREQVKSIIDELDRPVPQVLIKVLIAEVSHDNSTDLGADFSVLNKRPDGNGFTVGTNLGNAAAQSTGGLVVNLVEANITASLHALESDGKVDVLSRPYILASDNQLASMTVGQVVPFIAESQVTQLGQIINTPQYQDVGIILNVTPHINPEGLVILDVTPEISQLTNSTVTISPGVAAPIVSRRAADTRVAIRDGQTIVIGGLMEDRKISTLTKVPFFGSIPGIGPLFQRNRVEKTKTELLIFLTPHVAPQPESLGSMSKDELRGTKLTPSAVQPGVFDEHLHGMSRGARPATQPATKP